MRNKKKLSPEQREKLLKALKERFENNRRRHKGVAWGQVHARLKASARKLWSLGEMEELAANRTLLAMTKRLASASSTIVQPKVLEAAEVFVTTVKRWSQERNINRGIMLWIWQPPWALSS